MKTIIDIRELPIRIDELLALAAAGQEVILYDGVVARVRLVPMVQRKNRMPGLHLGAVSVSEDFDAPLPESFWLGEK